MFLSRAERELIRRRRRRRAAVGLAVVLALAAWASAQHNLPAHRHRRASVPARRSRPARHHRHKGNGTHRPPVLAAGAGLTWSDFHGIYLPASRKAGPRHVGKGLAWGFADTPTGGLLAAVNISVRTAPQWGPAIYTATIHRQVTGPGTAALLKADASGYAALGAAARLPHGQPAGPVHTAVTAYQFVTWSPGALTVDVVTEAPGSGGQMVMTATRIEAVWRGGDWRVLAPPGGDWVNSATPVGSLSGYTTFPDQR